MGQTSVGRLHGRLDVLQTSLPPSPSWIQDGEVGNDVIQDLGRVFRSLVRWRWKMAALPLPVAILDDLICGNRAAIFHLHLNGDRKTRPILLVAKGLCAREKVIFGASFPDLRNSGNTNQNNPLASAYAVCHSSTYIILFLT